MGQHRVISDKFYLVIMVNCVTECFIFPMYYANTPSEVSLNEPLQTTGMRRKGNDLTCKYKKEPNVVEGISRRGDINKFKKVQTRCSMGTKMVRRHET